MSHVTFETPSDLSIIVDQDNDAIEEPTLLSPRTMHAILSVQEPSPDEVKQIARSLAITLQARTNKHKKEVERLQG